MTGQASGLALLRLESVVVRSWDRHINKNVLEIAFIRVVNKSVENWDREI